MTADGWEQRLADLGQAREESIDLTPGVVWTDAQLSIVRDLAARSAKAQAAVKRMEALADEWLRKSSDSLWHHDVLLEHADAIRAALDGPT